MKRLLIIPFLFIFSLVQAQQANQVCVYDSSIVEASVYKTDTFYSLKQAFKKGDWEVYYDFALMQKKSEYHFDKSGNPTGVWKEWFKNGQLKEEWDYNNAYFPAFPPGKSLYADGKKETERIQRNDSLIETHYYKNGKARKENRYTKNGTLIQTTEWCEDGQQTCSYNPTAATPQSLKKYHCNGKVKVESSWFVYGYCGSYTEYHPNGKIAVKGAYQDYNPNAKFFMPKKTGKWEYFSDKGKPVKTEEWLNGKLIKTEKF
ncbi:MAG: hypothetical protein Fur0041_16610 [Bacteroidia bacterium]